MDAKTKAIVAHLTPIGWIIALVINMNQKEELFGFFQKVRGESRVQDSPSILHFVFLSVRV